MGTTVLFIITIILMIIIIIASIVPVVPAPALVWTISIFFALGTDFAHVGWFAVTVMSLLMIVGSTTGIWMQLLGMQVQGASCLSMVGAGLGGLIGTFVIPVPLLGTLIGIVIGALLFEFLRYGDMERAMQTGSAAASGFALGLFVEGGIAIAIVMVFAAAYLV